MINVNVKNLQFIYGVYYVLNLTEIKNRDAL